LVEEVRMTVATKKTARKEGEDLGKGKSGESREEKERENCLRKRNRSSSGSQRFWHLSSTKRRKKKKAGGGNGRPGKGRSCRRRVGKREEVCTLTTNRVVAKKEQHKGVSERTLR